MIHTRKALAKIAILKLSDHYEKTPEGNLWFFVLAQAIKDLGFLLDKSKPKEKTKQIIRQGYIDSMLRYFEGDIFAAEIIGINSEYVRRVLEGVGLCSFQKDKQS